MKKHHDLGHRLLINGVSAIIIALFIFFAEYQTFRWIFAAAVAAFSGLALWEYFQLLKKKNLDPAITLGLVATVLYVLASFYKTQGPHLYWESLWQRIPEIVLALAFFSCFVYYAYKDSSSLLNISTTFLGVVYIAIPFGLVIRTVYFFSYNGMEDLHFQGSWWILYLLAVTKSADMGGYFVGRFFGKRKLAMHLSPNKTLEGALGGLVGSVLVSLLICYLGKRFGHVFQDFTYVGSIWFGLIIGFFGQIGDLAESMLKRDADVKDSNGLPGVGGVLDMADSILFTAPIVYLFLRVMYT